ncbi:LCP family protein [Paucisalibacillus sp. EB02]|uniref:LCP family glycopolymer transferase n=1 Tax=Paucisalibacillus sp. EB02 TaxID=1347087 RepID=UPI0004AC9A86|nr:LCP family protein [Paucisalibacillus sp. EB02]
MSKSQQLEIKPKRIWSKIILGVVLLIIFFVGGYVLSIYNGVKETINAQMYQPLPSINQIQSEKKIVKKEPVNFLLLGINKQYGGKGTAETLLVISLNPKTGSMNLITIPRDTRAVMVGKETEDKINKINNAYSYGGADMAIESVENLLDLELDYYVQLNLAGVTELIDGLGGITINNELDIEIEEANIKLTPGELHLSGTQAYRYVEMLASYQGDEIDFTAIQDEIFGAIIQKGTTSITINKLETFADFLGDNVTTNLDFNNIEYLLQNYTGVQNNVTQYVLDGSKETIDDVIYLIVPDEEIEKVQQMIKEDDLEI